MKSKSDTGRVKKIIEGVLSIAAGAAVGIMLLPFSFELFRRIQFWASARGNLYLTALRSVVAFGSVLNGLILGLLPGYFTFTRRSWLSGILAALIVIIIYHAYLTAGPFTWGRNPYSDQLLVMGYAGLLGGGALGARLMAKLSILRHRGL